MKIEGDVAESWAATSDGLKFTFKLARRQVPRWLADDVGGRQGDLRADHQSAGRRRLGAPRALRGHQRHRDARRPHRRVQAEGAERVGAGRFRLALELHLQRGEAEAGPAFPETKIMGTGAFKFVESRQGRRAGKPSASTDISGRASPTSTATRRTSSSRTRSRPGIAGGQFDIEFRGVTPAERDQMVDADEGQRRRASKGRGRPASC